MRLVKYGHSCVRLERGGTVLVVDPGVFSDRVALDGADAVLITHEHPDHVDVAALADAAEARPGLAVYAHPDVLATLTGKADVTAVLAGDEFEAAGVPVRAYGGQHAINHPDIPRVANLGFLIDNRVYHPGDSFDVPVGVEVDTLLVPISAPWMKVGEAIDFTRAVRPRRAFGVHDGLLNRTGVDLVSAHLSRLGNTDYHWLAPGTTVDLGRG